LIHNGGVRKDQVSGLRDVKTVRVMCNRKTLAYVVWCITSCVIERKSGDGHKVAPGNVKAVDRPIPDIHVFDSSSNHIIEDHKVVRSRNVS
jgi:hypothetical protein